MDLSFLHLQNWMQFRPFALDKCYVYHRCNS
jgi:hypothetical protein